MGISPILSLRSSEYHGTNGLVERAAPPHFLPRAVCPKICMSRKPAEAIMLMSAPQN
jgi:hypothetical protein